MIDFILFYLSGLLFNIIFSCIYWYKYRRILKVNYKGALIFLSLSWLVYPVVLLRVSLRR
jgi:hypothetical protein